MLPLIVPSHAPHLVLKEQYDQGKMNFIANDSILIFDYSPKLYTQEDYLIFIACLMAKPVDTNNYRGERPVQLFAHNAMTLKAAREDIVYRPDNCSNVSHIYPFQQQLMILEELELEDALRK
ncbi:LOW QUALITY PROTEIN: hypothetical protein ACHAXN_001563 [Cyclotella atomus]